MKRIFIILGAIAFFLPASLLVFAEEVIWVDEEDEIEMLESEIDAGKAGGQAPVVSDSDSSALDEFESFEDATVIEEGKADKSSSSSSVAEDSSQAPSSEEAQAVEADSETEQDLPAEVISQIEEEQIDQLETDSSMDEYEKELYEIYIQYYSKKITPQEWKSIVSDKDAYVIQNTDTLWDISKVLFGDSNYWPKLWSSNPTIGNPHLIQTGNSLGFIYGTEGSPPALSIVGSQLGDDTQGSKERRDIRKKGKKILSKYVNRKTLDQQIHELDKKSGTGASSAVLHKIPRSLPPIYLTPKQGITEDSFNFSIDKLRITTQMFLRSYHADSPIYGQGFIKNKKEYGTVFHNLQRVVLEMRNPPQAGQKFLVVKNYGKTYSSVLGVRGPFGYHIEVQGQVEILGRMPDSFDLYEAKVTHSFHPIEINSVVINKELIQFDYNITDFAGEGEAQIIAVPSSNDEKQIASPYSLLFLNRGRSSGLSVGQMYQVKANPDVSKAFNYDYSIKLGEAKIIHAEDRFATATITQMSSPIHVGDYLVPLSQGLSTQAYDPLVDEQIEEETSQGSPSEVDFADFEDEDTFQQEDAGEGSSQNSEGELIDSDEEDVFEVF